MSRHNPNRAEEPGSGGGAPARHPITYNLAALRLAQSPNGRGQASPPVPSGEGGSIRLSHSSAASDVPLSVLLAGLSTPATTVNTMSPHPAAASGLSALSLVGGGRPPVRVAGASAAVLPPAVGYLDPGPTIESGLPPKLTGAGQSDQAPSVPMAAPGPRETTLGLTGNKQPFLAAAPTGAAPPPPPSSLGHVPMPVPSGSLVFPPRAQTNIPSPAAAVPSAQCAPSTLSAPPKWANAAPSGIPLPHSAQVRRADPTQPDSAFMRTQNRPPMPFSAGVAMSQGRVPTPQPLSQHPPAAPVSSRGAFHEAAEPAATVAAAPLPQAQPHAGISPPIPRSQLAGMPAHLSQSSGAPLPSAAAPFNAPSPKAAGSLLSSPLPPQQRNSNSQRLPYPLPQPLSQQTASARPSVPPPAPITANTASPFRPTPTSPLPAASAAPVVDTPATTPPIVTPIPAAAPAGAPDSAPAAASRPTDICLALQQMSIHARTAPYPQPPSTATAAAAETPTPAAASSSADSPIKKLPQLMQQPQARLNYYAALPPRVAVQREQDRYGRVNRAQRMNYRQPPPPHHQQRHLPSAPSHQTKTTPLAHVADIDPVVSKRFQDEYAQQNDNENIGDDLRAQQATKMGTIGTLDEELCLSLIETHDVTFVVTDTGTGKSTRIPMALHKAHPDALVVNAQPRRTAAINLAQRVAEVLDAELGEEVGYSVRGEHIGDLGETKIMYVTTYSLFIYFLWHEFKEKLPFSYIIVDEFHERTPDVEVILLMLKLWLHKHPGAFKLVLCSATAQVEEWQSFFDGLTVGTYARSPIMYPVQEYFIEDLQRLTGIRTAPILPQDSSNMVTSEQMHQLILVCKQLLEYLAKNTATQDSVLVFMPGRTQVELMTTWIRENLEESLEPIAWYRDVELSLIQEALARPAVTRKKVYIATDIAEVSLTLPDVVFVIDSGTGKRPQVSEKEKTSYAFPPLRLLWETTSNAQQRRGRVGRVQQGFYFSLLSRDHHKALRESDNRIKNAVLTELVLHSLLITQKPFAFFQLCNEKPERGALAYSLHLLQDGGHIIRKDDPMADAERVSLDRQRTTHVMDSPWNALIEEALAAAPAALATAPADAAKHSPATEEAAEDLGSSDEVGDKGYGDEGESVEAANPEADVEAFQQCYFMTLRGVIAARSPVSVAAATNVFFGLLYGTPTLSMLAAAIESSKSPFHVPYTVSDRMERVAMVRHVSNVMQRYHGSLQSDLICSMEVILEYMSMQRDGLSEEAQEEWCQERSLSRTRVVDTLNLFSQMKEQVSSVLPFPDVTDIDVLNAQFNQNAELLVLMLVASHTELAIQVQLDGPVAQRKGFVGHGMFFPLKCLKDESVPTVCPWDRTKISVPLSLQTIQRKVLAVFASQVEPDLFALVLLVFSYKLHYSVQDSGATPSFLMAVSHSGVRRTFQCDTLTAQQILQLRRIQCAQLRCMQLQVEERVKANESENLSAVLRSANSDFGLPESAMKTPYLIPTVLQHGLKLLVSRLKGSPSYTAQRRGIAEFPPGTPYCKLAHGVELPPPVLQSVLIHSNNGLSVLQPTAAAAAGAAPSATVGAATGAAEHSDVVAVALAEAPSAGVESKSESEDDDDSDRSSDSAAHVPTFSYDI